MTTTLDTFLHRAVTRSQIIVFNSLICNIFISIKIILSPINMEIPVPIGDRAVPYNV